MGPKSRKRGKSQTSPISASVVPDTRKTVKTVKRTTETMTQVNTPILSPQPQTPVTPIQPHQGP